MCVVLRATRGFNCLLQGAYALETRRHDIFHEVTSVVFTLVTPLVDQSLQPLRDELYRPNGGASWAALVRQRLAILLERIQHACGKEAVAGRLATANTLNGLLICATTLKVKVSWLGPSPQRLAISHQCQQGGGTGRVVRVNSAPFLARCWKVPHDRAKGAGPLESERALLTFLLKTDLKSIQHARAASHAVTL